MKKILFVSANLSRGGAQRVLTLIANAYSDKGVEVGIALLLDNEVGYPLNKNIKIFDMTRKGNYALNTAYWLKSLRRTVKAEKPDAIVSFVGRVNLITMLAAKGLKTPVLISERNDPANDRRSDFEVKLCKLFYKKADTVIFQTEYQKKFYGKACSNNSVIIGNPIGVDVYDGEHPTNDIISVGKLMKQKNHPMLIEAFSMVADEFPDVNVHIFGDGELYGELSSMINAKGLKNRVILEGNSSNVYEELKNYKYFVMCSNYEGLSNALLEAMLSGEVCISTAWNGIEDVIKDGENGYLVPCGDVQSLAQKLRFVLNADNEGVRKAGIKSAERFRTENIIDKWFDVVESVKAKGK